MASLVHDQSSHHSFPPSLSLFLNRRDDALDVWACHGMGGFIGSLLIGCFASSAVGGVSASGELFGKQLAAALLIGAYSSVITIGLLKAINFVTGGQLSPTQKQIEAGLDVTIHGEKAYHNDYEKTNAQDVNSL
jgi:Amt family ammonium transporter